MKGLAILLIITIIFYIFNGISNNTINFNGGYQPQTEIKQDYQSQTVSQPKQEYQYHMNTQSTYSSKETEVDPKDPLSLSMKRPYKYSDSELRKFLSLSELEWCSKVEQKDAVKRFVWILKSNNKEVYSCEYSYILQRKPKERSVIACQNEEGYQDYINGDKQLYREYIIPTVNDQVEFRPNAGNAYFESYYNSLI